MSELISVLGDSESHGGGELHASNNSGKFYVNGKKVVYINSTAEPDPFHPPPPTDSMTGSGNVFSEGIAIHRNNDSRKCGAVTIVSGQSKVYAG